MQSNPENSAAKVLLGSIIAGVAKARTLHSDQRGTISILSVITLLLLTMLLGMILNVGEQIDDKIKMQNAADAATYSSGVVVARGMNTIAFTNHLLSETFALTAYFREGRDRYAESLVPTILDAWRELIPQLALSDFRLIKEIQPAIAPKIQIEQKVVKTFSDMTFIKAQLLLPALEGILGKPENTGSVTSAGTSAAQEAALSHLIPVFQRAVVQALPAAVVEVSGEIARRNTPGSKVGTTQCVIWNTQTVPVQTIDQTNPLARLLPAIDPSAEGPDAPYFSSGETFVYRRMAKKKRDALASHYLNLWISDGNFDLGPFERETQSTGGRVSAKMSQFINLYRGFTCAKLQNLLDEEYPTTNLPHILRQPFMRHGIRPSYTPSNDGNPDNASADFPLTTQQEYLDFDLTFNGTVYRRQRPPTMPGMYRIPIKGDAVAFARVSVYLPRPRYRTSGCQQFYCISIDGFDGSSGCNTPCDDTNLGWPSEWSLFSQNWAARMIPTSAESTIALLQTNPQQVAPGVTLPDVRSMTIQDLKAINFH